jgi:hypothetical protein
LSVRILRTRGECHGRFSSTCIRPSGNPATAYADAVSATCVWLVNTLAQREFSDTYLAKYFDYAAEDAILDA